MKSNLQDGYTVQPQTKKELVDIIQNTCKKKGWNCDLNFIDTSKITDMSGLFSDFPSCFGGHDLENFNGDISKWNTSNVTNMFSMFDGATKFNQPLDKWNVSKVKNMDYMFSDAHSFNQPLDKWDVSNVTDMSYIFEEAKKFNQPLNNWNISKVTSMSSMFKKAISFNQPLNNWIFINFTGILGPLYMFKGAKIFDSKIPFFKDFEFHHFADKCKYLGLSHKYAEKHQHDF